MDVIIRNRDENILCELLRAMEYYGIGVKLK